MKPLLSVTLIFSFILYTFPFVKSVLFHNILMIEVVSNLSTYLFLLCIYFLPNILLTQFVIFSSCWIAPTSNFFWLSDKSAVHSNIVSYSVVLKC